VRFKVCFMGLEHGSASKWEAWVQNPSTVKK
jgi:hypothetical protein